MASPPAQWPGVDNRPTGSMAQAEVREVSPSCPGTGPAPAQGPTWAALPRPQLWSCHHTLLAVVHAPEAVELCEVHVGIDSAILTGWEGMGRPGTEEAPI